MARAPNAHRHFDLLAAADFEHVPKALRRKNGQARAIPLDGHIGGDRTAMDDLSTSETAISRAANPARIPIAWLCEVEEPSPSSFA